MKNSKEINVIPIGSGSTGNSIYIEMHEHRFLVDMGMGYRAVKKALEKNGRNIEDIEAIFVTHGHGDHVKAAVAIGNNTSCTVYVDPSGMYPIRDMKNHKEEMPINETIQILPGLSARAFPVTHDYCRTLGYVFESQGRKISYLTDCGKIFDHIEEEVKGSDLLIIESNHDVEMLKNGPYPRYLQNRILSQYGHLSNDECARMIALAYESGTRNFILAHLSRNNNTPELALQTVKERVNKKDIFVYACPESSDDLLSF